jgi:hypothetical protein
LPFLKKDWFVFKAYCAGSHFELKSASKGRCKLQFKHSFCDSLIEKINNAKKQNKRKKTTTTKTNKHKNHKNIYLAQRLVSLLNKDLFSF